MYGCTTLNPWKRLNKKLDGNYAEMLSIILNKFWKQHPLEHYLYYCLIILSLTTVKDMLGTSVE